MLWKKDREKQPVIETQGLVTVTERDAPTGESTLCSLLMTLFHHFNQKALKTYGDIELMKSCKQTLRVRLLNVLECLK